MRFINATLILCIGLFLEINAASFFGVSLGFGWAALFVAAFFLHFGELALLSVFYLSVMYWLPFFHVMTLIIFLVPLVASALFEPFRLKPFFGNLFFIICGTFGLYLIFAPQFFVMHPLLFIADLFLSAAFGACAFWIMEIATQPF